MMPEKNDLFNLPCCCDTRHTIREGGKNINIVVLNKKARSKFFAAHDLWLDGKNRPPRAAAIVCDHCLEGKLDIVYAYCRDRDDQEPYRVPVSALEDWTMEEIQADPL